MSNFEASSSSSNVGNICDVSTSSYALNFTDYGPSRSTFDLLIKVMKDILTAITDKGLDDRMVESRMKLRDTMEPIATDFSNLFEAISQGAKMFSDKKAFTNNLSSEAQSVALDILKGVGNAHWAAVGLLAIAKVLERLDKISTNDRDCIDLLKGMLDLAKLIRLLKHTYADLHTEILEKMSEAVHLIVSGAILCHSFITCNKFSKFLLAKKISEDLMYLRRKVDGMKSDMALQMNILIVSTITIHLPKQQHHDGSHQQQQRQHSDDAGRTEEIDCHTEEFPFQQSNHVDIADEVAEICTVETESESEIEDLYGNEGNLMDISSENNQHQLQTYKRRTFRSFGRHLVKYTVHNIQKPVHTVFGKSLRQRQLIPDFSVRAKHEEFHHVECLPIRFTIDELILATENFGSKKLLGTGSFAEFYRGILHDGREVAIKKRIKGDSGEALRRELVCIANLHHRNILKSVGYCITGDEVMLVYDYMPNGTVHDLLFDPDESHVVEWSTRLKIILGVIKAVDYLHQGLDVCTVHNDIKPSNVLVDENFDAKLSGFGNAKSLKNSIFDIVEVERYNFSAITENTETPLRGTMGYMAPEYLTIKADIFSFGMFLLNVVCGKKCLNYQKKDEEVGFYLRETALKFQQENRLLEIVDPSLVQRGDFNFNWGSILRTIHTAIWCIQEDPNKRPPASQALFMLLTKEEIPLPPQIQNYTRDNSSQSSSTSNSIVEDEKIDVGQ